MAAVGDDNSMQEAEELLLDLERSVLESYLRESDSSSHYEQTAAAMKLSVSDLNLDNGEDIDKKAPPSVLRHSTILLEVLEEWRKLVTVLKKREVFVGYVRNLRTAFRELKQIDNSLYKNMKTLLALLVQTAENSDKDDSTECRFVTLLEIVLSYGKPWSPSDDLTRFWVRLTQRIEAEIPPVNFRRKAYRILVSLSWVPSSRGLLEACSFDPNRQRIDPEKSPLKVRKHLLKIHGGLPQPRYDCVNQILDRLKDETDVCVAITSEREGMGKTTMAALVSSHPSILRVFKVLWLSESDVGGVGADNGGNMMTYEQYIKSLDDLCQQLSMTSPEWPTCPKRFEDPALRRLREEDAMKQARDKLAEALLERDENYLLVLDDFVDAKKIGWFRFNERQSIIVTTPNSKLEGVDWTVDLSPLSEEEAVDLFLVEAGLPVTHVLGLTKEICTIVRDCECHPLVVRTVARWYTLKVVTAGCIEAVEEIQKGIASIKSGDKDGDGSSDDGDESEEVNHIATQENGDKIKSTSILFDILSLMIAPVWNDDKSATILFVLSLSSLTAVFPRRTPLDSIILLWEQMLMTDSHALVEMTHLDYFSAERAQRHAWFIAEGLDQMGVISVTEVAGNPWVELHHKRYREFAMFMAKEMDLGEIFEETLRQWNRAFVTAYFTKRIEGNFREVDNNSWEYAIENLPSHVFTAQMFPMAETILGEENFFRARIEAMGWDRAVDLHIRDCVHLQRALQEASENENGETNNVNILRQPLSPVFHKSASIVASQAKGALVTSEASFIIEVSRALYKIGVALAENGYYKESVAQFDSAQNLLPQSQELRASILYGAAWGLLASNNTQKALKKVKASRKVMEEYVQDHILNKAALILQGECLVGECSYKDAVDFFDQTVSELQADADHNKIELGTALYKKGCLHHTLGDIERAVESFKDCLDKKNEFGETSRDLALVYGALGDICVEKGTLSVAREHYETAINVLDSLKYDPKVVDYSLLAGKLKHLKGESSESKKCFEHTRRAIKFSPILFMDQSAYDLRCVARCYHAIGDLPKAISLLQESLALTNERPYSLERSYGLHDLANCLIDGNQMSKGLIFLEQSLEIRILKLGECVQVLDTLGAIGSVHLSLGAYEESLAVFQKVDELTKRIAPDDIERIAGVLYSIGEVYDAKSDYTEATTKFNEGMSYLKQERSSDHPDVAKALQRLGDVTAAQSDLDTAYDYYCEALRIRQKNFDKRQLAETLHSIGVLARKRNLLDAAQEPLLDALEIRRNLDNGRETGQTLLEIGTVFRLQSMLDDAVSVFEKALEVLDKKDDIRACVYLSMGHTKLALKKDEDVLHCYENAREIRLAAYGKDNLKTGNVHRSLGLLKCLKNNAEEALVHLNEFIRVVELIDEEETEEEGDDADYVLAVTLMFDIHQAKGRFEHAKNLIDVAKEVCDESEEVREGLPALVEMVNRRCSMSEEDPSNNKHPGFLARLKLSDESVVKLNFSEEEENTLRNIPFYDE